MGPIARPLPFLLLLLTAPAFAQDLPIAQAAARIDTAIPWMTDDFYPGDPGRPVATLPKTGVDRGKLLDEALARGLEEGKPVLWYIPRIEGGHMVRPEFLDTYMRVVAFTDPVLASFIRSRFVPLRMAVDGPISKRTGITKLDWVEPALVILEGTAKPLRRLDRIRTFNRDYFHRWLAAALGEDRPIPPATGAGAVKYRLALEQIASGHSGEAERTFHEIVEKFSDFEDQWPYAAMAAANLMKGRDTTWVGPAFHGFDDLTPLPDAVYAESRPSTAWPRNVSETNDVVKRAVGWLLRHQDANGGFEDSRYAYCDSPRILPNVWMAITAIALAGLNDWRGVDEALISKAIGRGERYLFSSGRAAPGRNEECYADSFRLVYLTRELARLQWRAIDVNPYAERQKRCRRRLNDIAGCLVDQQSEAGWLAHEYPNPFATAAGLVAADQARSLGAAVPDNFFERGAKALRSARGDAGTFAYSAGRPGSNSESALRNAMGRMPGCELALMRAEKSGNTAALEASLDNFWKWLPRLERIRVCDFHSDGELGGFFFWHAMFLTSEAIKALPQEKRAIHNQKMLEHVLKIGEIDGSFVDSHELGKSYGTGMALMVLKNSINRPE